MKTVDEVINVIEINIDRSIIENYIAHEWLRPISIDDSLYFEEIDIARLQLIHHLSHDIQINDAGMDVALSLLDQLYSLRLHVSKINDVLSLQPDKIRDDILLSYIKLKSEYTD